MLYSGGCGGHGGRTLPINSSSNHRFSSSGLVAQSVAHLPLNWVVREDCGSIPAAAVIAAVTAAGASSSEVCTKLQIHFLSIEDYLG